MDKGISKIFFHQLQTHYIFKYNLIAVSAFQFLLLKNIIKSKFRFYFFVHKKLSVQVLFFLSWCTYSHPIQTINPNSDFQNCKFPKLQRMLAMIFITVIKLILSESVGCIKYLDPVNCSASNWLGVNIEATGTTYTQSAPKVIL